MEEKNTVHRKTVRSEDDKRVLCARVNRIAGQMNGIRKMIEEDRYCDDVLIQLSAVVMSIKSLANLMLDAHLHTCIPESIKNGDLSVLDEIVALFKRFQ